MIKAVAGKLRRWYRRRFQNWNHVFRHDGPFPPATHPDCRFERYESFESVPGPARDAIISYGGEQSLERFRQEMNDGAVLWVAFIETRVVGRRMTRRGRYFRSWFVPLEDEDIVIFRGSTDPAFRGRGISPAMMRHIMSSELATGGRAFADCRIYNHPSIRSIEKAGFKRIATMRPITRELALGENRTKERD